MSVYVPPALNAVDFALEAFTPADITPYGMALSVYTPPALSAVNFALSVYTIPTFPYVGWELLPTTPPGGFIAAWVSQLSGFIGSGRR